MNPSDLELITETRRLYTEAVIMFAVFVILLVIIREVCR